MKESEKHATVKVGGMTISLIGIPFDTSQQECSVCKKKKHLTEIHIAWNNDPICSDCLSTIHD